MLIHVDGFRAETPTSFLLPSDPPYWPGLWGSTGSVDLKPGSEELTLLSQGWGQVVHPRGSVLHRDAGSGPPQTSSVKNVSKEDQESRDNSQQQTRSSESFQPGVRYIRSTQAGAFPKEPALLPLHRHVEKREGGTVQRCLRICRSAWSVWVWNM